jgi:hypothetical protein
VLYKAQDLGDEHRFQNEWKSGKLPTSNRERIEQGAMDYERGLAVLKELARDTDWYQEYSSYEAALVRHLRDERLYGPSQQTTQEQMRVIYQLNRLALQHVHISFNDLCRGIGVPSTQTARLEHALGDAVCLYAWEDEPFYRALQEALGLWQRQNKISWLEPVLGSDVRQLQQVYLRRAKLILLVCSAAFFADAVCDEAMAIALQERSQRGVLVVPLLARACAWEESQCAHLEVLPENKRPINAWTQADQAYESIRQSLIRLSTRRG